MQSEDSDSDAEDSDLDAQDSVLVLDSVAEESILVLDSEGVESATTLFTVIFFFFKETWLQMETSVYGLIIKTCLGCFRTLFS